MIKNHIGQRFGRLLILEAAEPILSGKTARGASLCKCDCGNFITIVNKSLKRGETTSCGCFQAELAKQTIKNAVRSITKYDAKTASARSVWYFYSKELSFDDFLELSQQNCFYCGVEPTNIRNVRKNNNDIFMYNSLDRINSNLGHTKNNILPSCLVCNRF